MIDDPTEMNTPGGVSDDSVREFVRLYSAHSRRIYGYILCFVPNWSDAEDVLQETASILWTKFSGFRPGTDFLRWACRIARLVAANHYRKKKVRRSVLHLDEAFLESIARIAETSDLLDQDHRLDALHHCLGRLRDRDRKLIHWRYEAGASIRGIAERLGRSIDTVYKSLGRIHYQLLCCIENRLQMEER